MKNQEILTSYLQKMKEIVSDPRSQQMYTMTPLHVAVDKNDYESVYFFCSALSNILQKSESGIVDRARFFLNSKI